MPAADGVERVVEENTRIAGTPLGQRFTHGVEVLLFLGQGAECTFAAVRLRSRTYPTPFAPRQVLAGLAEMRTACLVSFGWDTSLSLSQAFSKPEGGKSDGWGLRGDSPYRFGGAADL